MKLLMLPQVFVRVVAERKKVLIICSWVTQLLAVLVAYSTLDWYFFSTDMLQFFFLHFTQFSSLACNFRNIWSSVHLVWM